MRTHEDPTERVRGALFTASKSTKHVVSASMGGQGTKLTMEAEGDSPKAKSPPSVRDLQLRFESHSISSKHPMSSPSPTLNPTSPDSPGSVKILRSKFEELGRKSDSENKSKRSLPGSIDLSKRSSQQKDGKQMIAPKETVAKKEAETDKKEKGNEKVPRDLVGTVLRLRAAELQFEDMVGDDTPEDLIASVVANDAPPRYMKRRRRESLVRLRTLFKSKREKDDKGKIPISSSSFFFSVAT